MFLWDVSLIFWEVVSVEFLHCSQDGLRNKALAAHFAIASWFGAVTQGHDTSNLRRALAADSSRHMVELSFTGCRGFGDDSLQQLLNHLPRLFGLGFQHVARRKLKDVERVSMIMEDSVLRKILPLLSYQTYQSFN